MGLNGFVFDKWLDKLLELFIVQKCDVNNLGGKKIETNARAFLTLDILAIGRVN